MPLPLQFTPSFGLVNGRPLFLDLMNDSYFLLEPEAERQLLEDLAENGSSADLRPVEWTPPTRSAARSGRLLVHDVVRVWRALRAARRGIASRGLADEIACTSRSSDSRRGSQSGSTPEFAAQRFMAARRVLPGKPHCLTDSLALLRYLGRHRLAADLVFGAKLDPFAAHCWVEHEGVLLNDHLDRILNFTPVGIVRP